MRTCTRSSFVCSFTIYFVQETEAEVALGLKELTTGTSQEPSAQERRLGCLLTMHTPELLEWEFLG